MSVVRAEWESMFNKRQSHFHFIRGGGGADREGPGLVTN